MRLILQALVGVATAVAVYVVLAVATLLIGGSDCSSGDCNWLGDAAADDPWAAFAVYVAISIGLGLLVARAVARRRPRA
ncbi:MAG TPA: hypothetical protein VGF25_01410 [Thermoleophilaceae bacterium]|jgi:peptidoglycan/LPS O-acetylase OafA/YrhL